MPGDWDLSEQLGAGGYGKVLKARNKTTGQTAAAKVISTSRMKRHAIVKEVELMELLNHPNIIGIYGHDEVGKNYIIYMELATRGELFSRVISQGCLSEDEARPYFLQLMSAVQFMHANGVVHRDLKLENVLLDQHDECKVCDFGLAHSYDRSGGQIVLTPLREVCGSKSYCAPEVLAGGGYDGFPTDVWSCGICLFGMLAGFFPLDEATGSDWRFERVKLAASHGCSVAHTIFGFYDRPCTLSDGVVEIIDGMLVIDPAKRMTVEAVLASPWVNGVESMDLGPPVYRDGGAANLDQAAINAMYAAEAPRAPVYRGYPTGPAPAPPTLLAKQNVMFCADFHYEGEADEGEMPL